MQAAPTSASKLGTTSIKEITGTVAGVRVKFLDTPGLQPGAANVGRNQKLINQMHKVFKKQKPDMVVYVDRADVFRC